MSVGPWRPTAGWAVLAAMLTVGTLRATSTNSWHEIALLWLLADLLWGGIWRLAGGRERLLPLRMVQQSEGQMKLPFLQPGSPAAQLLRLDEGDALPYLVRVAAPNVLVAAVVALTLGATGLALTAAVIVVTVAGWIARHANNRPPAMLHAVVTILLPWLLIITHGGADLSSRAWSASVVLMALWALHHWGESRSTVFDSDWLGVALLISAELGIALLLIALQAPLWLSLLVITWLPTWLAIYQRRPLESLRIWWLAAMLISAAAVGQAI